MQMESTAPASLSTHKNNFDILRLIAAWAVLFGHSFTLYGSHTIDPLVSALGYDASAALALSIFFIISGYLVTASWLKCKNPCSYFLHRLGRIIPALVVVIILTVFL